MSNKSEQSNRLVDMMSVSPELIGAEGLMLPFISQDSAQRTQMTASQLSQALVLDKAEKAHWVSGFESKVGKYTFDKLILKEDVHVVGSFSRCQSDPTHGGLNPSVVVVYVGLETGKISFHEIKSHHLAGDGFGWQNRWLNYEHRQVGSRIPKGESIQFQKAPNQDGDHWMRGINVNCSYISVPGVVEDSFIVDESMTRRTVHTRMHRIECDMKASHIPINSHGDEDEFKIFPDIGESVGEDGIVMALRNASRNNTFLCDQTDNGLRSINMHDTIIRAPAGAEIVDIEVYPGSKFKERQLNPQVYDQIMHYYRQKVSYYKNILDLHYRLKAEGHEPDNKWANLVEEAIEGLILENWLHGVKLKGQMAQDIYPIFRERGTGTKKRQVTTVDGKRSIEFLRIAITYAYKDTLKPGDKIVGSHGDKGVISAVWPDHRMPVDKTTGIRADAIFCPLGVPNRMNVGQLTETFLGRSNIVVTELMCKEPSYNKAYEILIDYLNNTVPEIAEIVQNTHRNKAERDDLVEEIRENGLTAVIHVPTRKTDYDAMINRVAERFGIKQAPVSYIRVNENGEEETVHLEEPVLIGSKYIMVLGKVADHVQNGVSLANVNQFQHPSKSSGRNKDQTLIRDTPIRVFGEDETALVTMSCGGDELARLIGLQASCPSARDELVEEGLLRSPSPSALDRISMSTKEVLDKSTQIKLLHHTMGVLGVSLHSDKTQ